MAVSAKNKTYETLHSYIFTLFVWMLPFVVGSILFIFALRLHSWSLWPLIVVFLFIPLIVMTFKIIRMRKQYLLYCKKYGKKEYSSYMWKTIWIMETYGIIILCLLLFSLVIIVFSN